MTVPTWNPDLENGDLSWILNYPTKDSMKLISCSNRNNRLFPKGNFKILHQPSILSGAMFGGQEIKGIPYIMGSISSPFETA